MVKPAQSSFKGNNHNFRRKSRVLIQKSSEKSVSGTRELSVVRNTIRIRWGLRIAYWIDEERRLWQPR